VKKETVESPSTIAKIKCGLTEEVKEASLRQNEQRKTRKKLTKWKGKEEGNESAHPGIVIEH
jgi:hypothetical protein